ncbi:MAG: type IV pilus modification protein PilV [Gammaproteobacteria bacterium]|nr:type IV pilus modification protein PilV [Gammaproteobacteria bacterium]
MTVSRKEQGSGFTLIEVLVTLLVLSIGLLGLAGMQITALKNSHGSSLRNQATALSQEIGERIRSNRADAQSGAYDIAVGALPADSPDCETAPCSGSEMAAYDLNEWKAALTNQLPAGDGAITHSGGLLTVRLFWDERRNDATGTGCDPDNPADLACFEMSFVP